MQSCIRNIHSQKTGWLHKRGGRIQTWHKRWFVLTGDLLFYYKSPQDSRPTGTIPLAGNEVIRHQDDSRQPNSFKFEIVAGNGRNFITSTHDSYLISADSADEADSWVATIKRVLHEPYGGGMFGRDLDETMAVEARLGGTYIPILVHRCAKFIREHGVEEIGIFRLPGQNSRVQALKDLYDNGCQLDIPATEDTHTVASLLKLYLRELPKPVIPYNLFNISLKATKLYDQNKTEGVTAINDVLKQLPTSNYNLLKYLSRFLHEVADNSDKNKMNAANLATVFGPNLMRPETPTAQDLIESSSVSANFICTLIRSHEEFFPYTADERPPKRLSVVTPTGFAELVTLTKTSPKGGGSLFIKSTSESMKSHRSRVGSVPSRFLSPPRETDRKKKTKSTTKFFAGLESPRQSKKSNAFSFSSSNLAPRGDSGFARVSNVIISPVYPQVEDGDVHTYNSNGERIIPGILAEAELVITEDDTSSPEILTKPSSSPTPSEEELRSRSATSESCSPELLVNSIAKEMESLERQLQLVKDTLAKTRKECRLWKSRYEQERRARLASEERISGLQSLIDQTFQQFALDDSEDDDFEDDSISVSGDSLNEALEVNVVNYDEPPCTYSPSTPVSPLRQHKILSSVRHIRTNSTC